MVVFHCYVSLSLLQSLLVNWPVSSQGMMTYSLCLCSAQIYMTCKGKVARAQQTHSFCSIIVCSRLFNLSIFIYIIPWIRILINLRGDIDSLPDMSQMMSYHSYLIYPRRKTVGVCSLLSCQQVSTNQLQVADYINIPMYVIYIYIEISIYQ